MHDTHLVKQPWVQCLIARMLRSEHAAWLHFQVVRAKYIPEKGISQWGMSLGIGLELSNHGLLILYYLEAAWVTVNGDVISLGGSLSDITD